MEGNTGKIVGALVAIALIVGGVVWATSSSDEETTADTSTTTEQTATPAPAEEEAVAQSNIVELAQATESLSTLVDAVVAAELVETLSGDGPFTVFAPTNDAFAALQDGTLASLLEPENQADLAAILTYHVVAGKVMAADLSDGQVVETVNGDTLTVSIEDGVVMIGDATVASADIEASNGVVHVIDSVLLPN